jgi:AmmeMemoRadiSam system protein B
MRPSHVNTSIRPPVVAGLFYPDDPAELRGTVASFLASVQTVDGPPALSYIVPHAGYVYSGSIAAVAYGHMQRTGIKPKRVVLIGPSHRVFLRGVAICEANAFRTPLGTIPVDAYAKRELLQRGDVILSDVPHAREHSLEVQLPFLQFLFGEFELIPLVVGDADPEYVAAVLDAVSQSPDTLLLASSDMSHYLPYDEARRVDADTNERILRFANTLSGEQACGAVALNGLLTLANARQAAIAALSLKNSGDTGGDRSRVVGYAAYLIDDHRGNRSH